jgi:hypothetical protein
MVAGTCLELFQELWKKTGTMDKETESSRLTRDMGGKLANLSIGLEVGLVR